MWITDACNVFVVRICGLYAGVQSRLGFRPYGVRGKRGKCGLLVESWVDSRAIGADYHNKRPCGQRLCVFSTVTRVYRVYPR
jgi:hypothetical protein